MPGKRSSNIPEPEKFKCPYCDFTCTSENVIRIHGSKCGKRNNPPVKEDPPKTEEELMEEDIFEEESEKINKLSPRAAVNLFIQNECEVGEKIKTADLFQAYTAWSESVALEKILSRADLVDLLRDMGYEQKKIKTSKYTLGLFFQTR